MALALLPIGIATAADIFLSTSFHEPATDGLRFIYSRDGLRWDSIQGTFLRPHVGSQRLMRDPSIAKGPDGVFHLVWTCGWKGDRGFGYSSSRDLIHWTKEQFVEVMDDTATVNVWAPELFYDDEERLFVVIWASCVPGRFPDHEEAHDNNHRLYYSTTKDFKSFSKAKLLFDPGFSSIDATVVKRGQGDYLLVFKDNSRSQRNIKVAFASSPYGPWGEVSDPFTENFAEGPSAIKVDGWWHIYYDSYRLNTYGAAKTRDFQHFENITDEVAFPAGHKHGTVFMADDSVVEKLIRQNTDAVRYTGSTVATPQCHDGGLPPVVGVHNIQTMRASQGALYNHQPMMAYWRGRFYMHYLTNPRSEHEPPGKTMLQTSADGYTWTAPVVLFPEYDVPDGFAKSAQPNLIAKGVKAVMHQRMGFYVSKDGKLIATGNYGVALDATDDPNDGNGIGRVAREIRQDGTFGPIYFIYYNHGFSEANTAFPYYKNAADKGFVKACDEMLASPMLLMQWVEEADRGDSLLPLKTPYKAFSGYTLPDGRKVALWKHALTSVSRDGGATWRTPVERAKGFVNANGKIWGQRLSDGTYATVYNPAEYRWPLAISLSDDGLEYNTLNVVNGEVTPERHWGRYKSYGPQYVRGIVEGNGSPPYGNLWVAYSNNKEDMWVSRTTVPVRLRATGQAHERFGDYKRLADMNDWNIYSPLWASVELRGDWLRLSDKDPYDYARVEKVIPASKELTAEFDIKAAQNDHGELHIEFLNDRGDMCSRIVVAADSAIRVKGGARYGTLVKRYEADRAYHVAARLSVSGHTGTYFIDGKKVCSRMFDTPVDAITRIVFRTGSQFTEPSSETPADQTEDMPRADEQDAEASFYIANLTTSAEEDHGTGAVLNYDDFAHYATYFNNMEDESIVTDIPNSRSSEWMERNIPLFDCPDADMEQMYYYRWWSLRKHLTLTPAGWGMTEFLVKRSYADKHNLIACAVGHHIMESRWLRDTTYLKQMLNVWYHGNSGKPMEKMPKFSSWNPAAVFEAYKVWGDTTLISTFKPSLEEEYARWKSTNLLESGLYWQEDVKDGMEESISGGRKERYARPTINSYQYGNAMALAAMNSLTGDEAKAKEYRKDASRLKRLIENKLWNKRQSFFETMRGDTLAAVREAIGYIPWYFNMPTAGAYDEAWRQVDEAEGFSAPYGLTTAERRHPQFRSHGTGTCEWDGAVWPFATSQTLTALANYINGYPDPIVGCDTFFKQMKLYTESQHHRGRPYIGEYLDETNGAWLMGDKERSRYYNHSTFADLIITGIAGLRPQDDGSVVVNPLVPSGKWDYFCLDNILYHGHALTILYDKTGSHYHCGRGLRLLIDGKTVAQRDTLGKLTYNKGKR